MSTVSKQESFVNPIIPQRADPWVYKHTDGYYYFTGSVPEYDRIEVRRARSVQELDSAEPVVVWRKYDEGPMSANIWAPEIHFVHGKWYIYFAAARTTATVEGLLIIACSCWKMPQLTRLKAFGKKRGKSRQNGKVSHLMRPHSYIMTFNIWSGHRKIRTSWAIPTCILHLWKIRGHSLPNR